MNALIQQLTRTANRDFKCLIADTLSTTGHESDREFPAFLCSIQKLYTIALGLSLVCRKTAPRTRDAVVSAACPDGEMYKETCITKLVRRTKQHALYWRDSLSAVPSVASKDTHPSPETTPVRVKVKRATLSPSGQAVIVSPTKQ